MFLAILYLVIGVVGLYYGNKCKEISKEYPAEGDKCKLGETCEITITLDEKFDPPIYVAILYQPQLTHPYRFIIN